MAIETACETTIGRHTVRVLVFDMRQAAVALQTLGSFVSLDEVEQVGRMLIAAAERARTVEAQLRQLEAEVRGEEG